jgi:hypothetical protein
MSYDCRLQPLIIITEGLEFLAHQSIVLHVPYSYPRPHHKLRARLF